MPRGASASRWILPRATSTSFALVPRRRVPPHRRVPAKRDLINFDPKAPPRKTEAFHDIVDTSRSGEDAEMADALDKLKNPIVVTLDEVARAAPGNFAEWLRDRRNRRVIPHRFEANDYERVRNGDSKDGLWVIGGVRQAVFGRKEMDRRTLIEQVRTLQRNSQRR